MLESWRTDCLTLQVLPVLKFYLREVEGTTASGGKYRTRPRLSLGTHLTQSVTPRLDQVVDAIGVSEQYRMSKFTV